MQQTLANLVAKVVEDGELEIDEIKEIISWFNENPDWNDDWPGNKLGPLLKNALRGKLTKREIQRIGKRLCQINRESARRNRDEKASSVVSVALEIFNQMSPMLPMIPISYRIESHSTSGVHYRVDLAKPSCDCGDFKRRSILPDRSPSRCCKHIFEAFAKLQPTDGWPSWLDGYLEQSFPCNPKTDWYITTIENSPVLYSSAPSNWANVIAPAPKNYSRFGYSVLENRWSYGNAPSGSFQLEKLISTV